MKSFNSLTVWCFSKFSLALLALATVLVTVSYTSASASTSPASVAVAPGILALDGSNQYNNLGSPVCTSADFCISVGGSNGQLVYATQIHGTWGTAQTISKPSDLASNEAFYGQSSSCWSDGNCAIIGHVGNSKIFVATMSNFVITGTTNLSSKFASLSSPAFLYPSELSCVNSSACTLTGMYQANSGDTRPYVIDEVAGIWQNAIPIPGQATIRGGGVHWDQPTGLQCTSAGNCVTTGEYNIGTKTGLYIASEVNGVWQDAQDVDLSSSGLTLTAAGSTPGYGNQFLSCSSTGNCSAIFPIYSADRFIYGFIHESNGTWGAAQYIDVTRVGATAGDAYAFSGISCPDATTCEISGFSYNSSFTQVRSFVVVATNGVLGTPLRIPWTHSLVASGISCATAGNCLVAAYEDPTQAQDQSKNVALQIYVSNGLISAPATIAGLSSIDLGQYSYFYGTCVSSGFCSLVGMYKDSNQHYHAFVGSASVNTVAPQFPTLVSDPSLGWTEGLAVNSTNDLFIANYGAHSVLKYSSSGVLSTTATMPGGEAKGLALDVNGNLYMVNQSAGVIYRESAATISSGVNATVENSGLTAVATVDGGGGLAFDSGGNLFYAQGSNIYAMRASSLANSGVLPLTTSSGIITIANSTSLSNKANADLTFDNLGNLYVAEGDQVVEISAAVVVAALNGTLVPSSSVKVILNNEISGLTGGAVGVKTNSLGDLIVSDDGPANQVLSVSASVVLAAFSNGSVIPSSQLTVLTKQFGYYEQMSGMAYSPLTGILYVGDGPNSRIFASTVVPRSAPVIYSKPTAPSNVTASIGNGTATVSFTPGISGNLPTFNQIDMLINGQPFGNVCNVTGATSCPISNLGPDAAFSFTVTAVNSKGSATSSVSNVVSYASPKTVAPTTTTTTMPPAKQTITCIKGKITKKVTAASPVCPAGFKKK